MPLICYCYSFLISLGFVYGLIDWNQWLAGVTSWGEVWSEWPRDIRAFGSKGTVWRAKASSTYWWVHTNAWRREWDLLYSSRKASRCLIFYFCFQFFLLLISSCFWYFWKRVLNYSYDNNWKLIIYLTSIIFSSLYIYIISFSVDVIYYIYIFFSLPFSFLFFLSHTSFYSQSRWI